MKAQQVYNLLMESFFFRIHWCTIFKDRYDNNRTVINAVVNLAGENVFGRWTKEKKKRILESRVNTTKSLCKALASLDKPPQILVSASATGYYGDRGNELLTEDSSTSSTTAASANTTRTVVVALHLLLIFYQKLVHSGRSYPGG